MVYKTMTTRINKIYSESRLHSKAIHRQQFYFDFSSSIHPNTYINIMYYRTNIVQNLVTPRVIRAKKKEKKTMKTKMLKSENYF